MKNVFIHGLVVSSALGLGPALLACSHDKRVDSAHEAKPTEITSARNTIVSARCDREQRCSNIGAGRDYENRNACTSKLEGKTGSDLNAQDCSRGVDQPKLSGCLSKIRTEDCGNPIDSLSRFAACRTGEICIGS